MLLPESAGEGGKFVSHKKSGSPPWVIGSSMNPPGLRGNGYQKNSVHEIWKPTTLGDSSPRQYFIIISSAAALAMSVPCTLASPSVTTLSHTHFVPVIPPEGGCGPTAADPIQTRRAYC